MANVNLKERSIEIKFDSKPATEVLETLKSNGFRWSSKNRLWYAQKNEATMKIADSIRAKSAASAEPAACAEPTASIFDLTREAVENHSDMDMDVKKLAATIKRHMKERFPMVKCSATSSNYDCVHVYIVASPFAKDSEILIAISDYLKRYAKSYNRCICYDPYGDYGSSYRYYIYTGIAWDYEQAELTVAMANLEQEFMTTKAEIEAAEEERRAEEAARRYEQWKAEQEAAEKREAEEKIMIAAIESRAEVKDVDYFMVDLDNPGFSKCCCLSEYDTTIGTYTCKVFREVHMTAEDYDWFSNHLLEDWTFIQGTGGSDTDDPRLNSDLDWQMMTAEERKTVEWYSTDCVAIVVDGVTKFVVDAQGFGYCRYVYLVGVSTHKEKTLAKNDLPADVIEEAEWLEDISASIISADTALTWDGDGFDEWAEKMTQKLDASRKDLNLDAIRAVEGERLKAALYKLNGRVNSVQGKFRRANLIPGQRVTLIDIDSWLGGANLRRITVGNVAYRSYAQYTDNVALTYRQQSKRTDYILDIHGKVLVYDGWLPDLPREVLYTVTHTDTVTIEMGKYMSFDDKQLDDMADYIRSEWGQLPIIDTRR